MIVDELFRSVNPVRFLEEQFPHELVVSHGSRERMGAVAHDARLCDAAGFCRFFEISEATSATRESRALNSADLNALVNEIREGFGLRPDQIHCSIIYTADGAGTGKHYDGIEGLTIQMCGKKLWRAERGPVPVPGRMGTDPKAGRMPEGSFSYTLESGSAAFLPRGWWHDTKALEPAISLHFELHLDCWLSLILDRIQNALANSRDLWTPVPLATHEQKRHSATETERQVRGALRRIESQVDNGITQHVMEPRV